MPPSHQAILKTIVYFDLFDYPLTALEAWRFLYAPGEKKNDFETVLAELQVLSQDGKLENKDGFYFLPGRAEILRTAKERYGLSFTKFRKARAFAKILSFVPGVRLAAVGNNMAWRHSRKESDIDFFIAAAPGRIWSARFFCALLAALLGARPKKGSECADAVCLSFFVSEDGLALGKLMLPEDIYFPYWVASLVPIADAGGVFEKFKAANSWVGLILPNVFFRQPPAGSVKKLRSLNLIPDFFETMLKRAQMRIFPSDIRRQAEFPSGVVISDQCLKFHTDDKRSFFYDAWRERCRQIMP